MISLFKFGLISVTFAFGALTAIPAQANDREIDAATDLYKQPICDFKFRIVKGLSIIAGQEPSGIGASNNDWDMEIYLNKERGDWTLVGKSKATDASPNKVCMLAKGLSTAPYATQKWYVTNFISAAKPEK